MDQSRKDHEEQYHQQHLKYHLFMIENVRNREIRSYQQEHHNLQQLFYWNQPRLGIGHHQDHPSYVAYHPMLCVRNESRLNKRQLDNCAWRIQQSYQKMQSIQLDRRRWNPMDRRKGKPIYPIKIKFKNPMSFDSPQSCTFRVRSLRKHHWQRLDRWMLVLGLKPLHKIGEQQKW